MTLPERGAKKGKLSRSGVEITELGSEIPETRSWEV